MKKIVLITNIPNAYRIPLFNELNNQFTELNYELIVIFAAGSYNRRKSVINMTDCNFKYIILGSEGITPGADEEKTYFSYDGLLKTLKDEKPYRIIVSGFSRATVKVWWYSKIHRIKYIIRSGAIQKKGRNDSVLRNLLRNFLTRSASSCIAYGSLAAEYLQSMGAAPSHISIGINTVDTQFFRNATAAARLNNVSDGKHHLTFTGYLVPRKNVIALLKVIQQLALVRTDFCMDIIGDGSDRPELEAFVKQQKLENFVVFHGFKQKDELPELLAMSSVFLFQTGFDIWGLTLNEAMAAEIPCIASIHAGSAKDLITHGENGFIADYDQPTDVVALIQELLNDLQRAKKMGVAAGEFIREHASLPISAKGFINAVKLSE
ncbi:MAG: glycosyltransferase family 4 protein [Bacteroidota bacterium]